MGKWERARYNLYRSVEAFEKLGKGDTIDVFDRLRMLQQIALELQEPVEASQLECQSLELMQDIQSRAEP